MTPNTTTSSAIYATIHAATSAINSADTSATISSATSAITPGQIAIGVTPKSPHIPSTYNPTSGEPSDAAIEESVMLMVGGLDFSKVFFL